MEERIMDLNEYVEDAKKSVDEFRDWWTERRKEAPEDFPLEMSPGDWDEQFRSFLSYRVT
jgi:hypothetical protein